MYVSNFTFYQLLLYPVMLMGMRRNAMYHIPVVIFDNITLLFTVKVSDIFPGQ